MLMISPRKVEEGPFSPCPAPKGLLRTGVEAGQSVLGSWDLCQSPREGHLLWGWSQGTPATVGSISQNLVLENVASQEGV